MKDLERNPKRLGQSSDTPNFHYLQEVDATCTRDGEVEERHQRASDWCDNLTRTCTTSNSLRLHSLVNSP